MPKILSPSKNTVCYIFDTNQGNVDVYCCYDNRNTCIKIIVQSLYLITGQIKLVNWDFFDEDWDFLKMSLGPCGLWRRAI
jgi:hypothetical protein